tara:strand:- start:161 stop:298 length:138 start_codon:yes stop_codon:yes gene_type:complete
MWWLTVAENWRKAQVMIGVENRCGAILAKPSANPNGPPFWECGMP